MQAKIYHLHLWFFIAFLVGSASASAQTAIWTTGRPDQKVIQSIVHKSISMQGFCSDTSTTFVAGPNTLYDRMLDIPHINDIDADFIGRAAYWWQTTYNPEEEHAHFKRTYRYTTELKNGHPNRVVQGGVFEVISSGVTYTRKPANGPVLAASWDGIPIPNWVWKAWHDDNTLPPIGRTFEFEEIRPAINMGTGYSSSYLISDTPDITKLEARMWFYYRACSYIASGIEALHMGQWHKIGKNDTSDKTGKPDNYYTSMLIEAIRTFAKNGSPDFKQFNGIKGAPRGYVLLDCHSKHQIQFNGNDLFDFYSCPVRPKKIVTQGGNGTGSFYNTLVRGAELSNNYCHVDWDGPYNDQNIAPNLYLVEVDNDTSRPYAPFFREDEPTYGWDDISWFGSQPAAYRADWLRYASSWLACNAPNISLEMPARREMTVPTGQLDPNGNPIYEKPYYRFDALPNGAVGGTPEVTRIKEIWTNVSYSPAHAMPNTLFGSNAVAASNVAIEFDGKVFWVDPQTHGILYGECDGQGSEPTNWHTGYIQDANNNNAAVDNAAGDLMFKETGVLFYRTTDNRINYCQYIPNTGWVRHGTEFSSGVFNGADNVAGNLVFEVGNTNARVNEWTVFYRSTTGGLEYVRGDGSGNWSHYVITAGPGVNSSAPTAEVDEVKGAIVCLKMGRVAIISQGNIKAYYWSGPGTTSTNWSEFSPAIFNGTVLTGTVGSSLAVQPPNAYNPTGNPILINLYYRSNSNIINYLHVDLPAGTPAATSWGWDGWIPRVTDVAGDFNFLDKEYLMYRTTSNGIAVVRSLCLPGPNPTQDWVREKYNVQNCARGLVRQRDGSLFYIDQNNTVQYLTWEAKRCTESATALRTAAPSDMTAESARPATAYPNPASETLVIPAGATGAVLLNSQGRAVQRPRENGKLDVRELPAGLYNLQTRQNGKFVNQHIEVKH